MSSAEHIQNGEELEHFSWVGEAEGAGLAEYEEKALVET